MFIYSYLTIQLFKNVKLKLYFRVKSKAFLQQAGFFVTFQVNKCLTTKV